MEKLAERVRLVIAERLSRDKTSAAIERQRRLEHCSSTCFEAQPFPPARPRFADQMVEQKCGNAFSKMIRMGPHRFDFAVIRAQRLQRANSDNVRAVSHAPDGHLRSLQPRQIQRKHAARRRGGMHAFEVDAEKIAGGFAR